MGWTSLSMHEPVKEWFKNKWGTEYEVLDSALVNRKTLFGAIKNIRTGDVFCAVFLILWNNSNYNFTYKDMTEFVGPIEVNCPKRIMKLLSPLNDENDPSGYARRWRQRVENYWAERENLKGKIIKLSEPINFTNGDRFQYFKKEGRITYGGIMDGDKFYPKCRVRINFSYYSYDII